MLFEFLSRTDTGRIPVKSINNGRKRFREIHREVDFSDKGLIREKERKKKERERELNSQHSAFFDVPRLGA